MEKHHMVLTAIGPDRPGIVKAISSVIHQAGANLEDSTMAILANEFALLVLFSGSAESIERVKQESRTLEQELNFTISFKSTIARGLEPTQDLFHLEVTGIDQPGIVHHVSDVLASHQINVVTLDSRLIPAAFSGTPLFKLTAQIQIPHCETLEVLQREIEDVCEKLDLSYQLEPRESASESNG